MKFTVKNKIGLSDVNIPDLFFENYINSLELIDLKVYIYICYLTKNNIEVDNLYKRLNMTEQELSYSLDRLQTEELLTKTTSGFNVTDLKEKEINKLYTPKLTPKKSKEITQVEQARTLAANAINDSFFGGLMSFSWYTDIGIMFDKYKFSEEVMIALFHHCNEYKALSKQYVYKVAENWFKGNVKTFEQLEEYQEKTTRIQNIMNKIIKDLRLNRALTKYEEKYVYNWIEEYKYDFSMIEEALKRTVNKTSPSISYINGILSNWYKKGYKKSSDILNETKQITNKIDSKTKFKNYEQRNYNNLESFYDNV
jgi:DnaD/phage-associated family protein